MVRVSARFYTAIISTFPRSPLSRAIRSHTTFQILIDRLALVFHPFFLFSVLLSYSDISSGLSDIYRYVWTETVHRATKIRVHPILHCFTIIVLHRRLSNVQTSFRFHHSVSFRSDVNWVANEYLPVHRFIRQEEEGQELFQTLLFQCTSTNCSLFLSSFIEVLSKLGSIYLCFSLLL